MNKNPEGEKRNSLVTLYSGIEGIKKMNEIIKTHNARVEIKHKNLSESENIERRWANASL